MKLTIYGCRGSVPLSRGAYSRHGGNTSCMKIETEEGTVILDAGTGILQLESELRKSNPNFPNGLRFDILLSHLHLDHTIGLTSFAPVWNVNSEVCLYTQPRGSQPLKSQVFGAFKPPYWPVPMETEAFANVFAIHEGVSFTLSGVFTVTPFAANHPDNTTSFHITDGKKTLVYMLDNEVGSESDLLQLAERCKDADAVIYDATYHPSDYPSQRGWGHSTVEIGVRLARLCGCKKMIFAHFGQEYDDEDLDRLQNSLSDKNGYLLFAHDGMDVTL